MAGVLVKVGGGALGGRERGSPRDRFSGGFQLFLDFETESEERREDAGPAGEQES